MFDIKKCLALLCLMLAALPVLADGGKPAEYEVERKPVQLAEVFLKAKAPDDAAQFGLSDEWASMVTDNSREAYDITGRCQIRVSRNRNDKDRLTDDRYKTYWNGGTKGWIEFTLPEGMRCYGIYIKWAEKLSSYILETPAQDGTWLATGARHDAVYYNEYIPVNGLTHFRIRNDNDALDLCITEVQLLSAGYVPDWVERWKPFEGEADLLVLSAHPDDEILWFGGTIPYYRSERLKKVLVVNVSEQPASRKCELLDCLWTCGIREYPIVSGGKVFVDRYASQVRNIMDMWGEENIMQFLTGVIRRYRPLVAVTHGFNGEYGHGAHKSCAYALTKCLELAANPNYLLGGADAVLDPWQIRKVYIHLYEENTIEMNWRVPLASFGGRTGFDVACEAFSRHRTQDTGKYLVQDFGKYDNRRFGLYFTAVGPDVMKNDFFENITEERGIAQAE